MNNNPFIPSPPHPKQEPLSDSPSPSRKRPGAFPRPRFQVVQKERDRRVTMNHFLSTLQSMLPDTHSNKVTRTTIVDETIEYIKLLEGIAGELEDRKKSIQMGDATTYSSEDSDVSVVVSGEMVVFGICLEVGRCLVTKVLMVFGKYNVEILAANVTVEDGVVKLTVTAFVGGGTREVVEMIKGEIRGLVCSSFV